MKNAPLHSPLWKSTTVLHSTEYHKHFIEKLWHLFGAHEKCAMRSDDDSDWKNASWNGKRKKGDGEADDVSHELPAGVWNEVWNQPVGDAVNVMRNADKHKWSDDDIHDRVTRNENKKTMSVSS